MEEKEFSGLIDRYQKPVFSIFYRMTNSFDTATDLTQEVFVRLWRRIEMDSGISFSFTLIYKIAMNLATDFLRHKRIEQNYYDLQQQETLSEENPDNELMELIHKCVTWLKPKQKAVFILRDLEGFSFDEISAVLDEPVNNIRSNLHLARRKIKELLIKKYNFSEENFYE